MMRERVIAIIFLLILTVTSIALADSIELNKPNSIHVDEVISVAVSNPFIPIAKSTQLAQVTELGGFNLLTESNRLIDITEFNGPFRDIWARNIFNFGPKAGNTTPTSVINLINIRINSTPPGAEIWMDGRYSGQLTPGKFVFKHPENHTFELRLVNYSKELNLNISDSEDIDVDLTGFYPSPFIPIAGPHANILIDSNPRGAEVWKDNVSTNKSTPFSEVSGVFELHTYELRLNNHIDKFTLFTDRNIKINVSI